MLLEELSNTTYSCLLTLTVVRNLVRSNQLNVSRFVIHRQLLPSHSPEIPCRPSKSVPSERLRLVKWFISHRLHTVTRSFVAPIADLISSHGLSFHQFADDTQLYVSVIPKSPQASLDILDKCSCPLLVWFSDNGLALNPTKSEVLFCGIRVNVDTTHQIQSVQVASCGIEPPDTIKRLRGYLGWSTQLR